MTESASESRMSDFNRCAESVIALIAQVFPTKMPRKVRLEIENYPRDADEVEKLHRDIKCREWNQVPDEVYQRGYAGVGFLGEESMKYYLPGLMVSAIRNISECGWESTTLESWLAPEGIHWAREPKGAFERFRDSFSVEQRQAIRRYLEFDRDYHYGDSPKLMKRIERLYIRHWRS